MLLWLAFRKCTLTVPYQLTNWRFVSIFPLTGFCHFLCKCLCNIWWEASRHLHFYWRVAPIASICCLSSLQLSSLPAGLREEKTQQLSFSDVETPSLGFTPAGKERRRTWKEVKGKVQRYHHSPECHWLLPPFLDELYPSIHPWHHEVVRTLSWCWMERARTCAGGWGHSSCGGAQLSVQLWLWIFTPGQGRDSWPGSAS